MTVHDEKTGEVFVEKKFYKSDFGEILGDPAYSKYCDDLLEKVMVKVMNDNQFMNIDHESYEEVRAVSLELESNLVDPEA